MGGLVLLRFDQGQQYPVIIGENSFTLHIKDANTLPSFTGSAENTYFYELLTKTDPGPVQYDFPLLMIQAKRLLDSSSSIHSVDELSAMKEKFHGFVNSHYQSLQHSDMLTRLIDQYFMMHEYVDFHIQGAPASDIQTRYEKAVNHGVAEWIELLKPHIPGHEVLNYCVSLYYNRSMVSLAHHIMNNFKTLAYCPGNTQKSFSVPEELSVIDADGNKKGLVKDYQNRRVISFVSDDCPVSMVATVARARRLAIQEKNKVLIVVPLQKLSAHHFAMRRMLTRGNMLFVNDEKWLCNMLSKKRCNEK